MTSLQLGDSALAPPPQAGRSPWVVQLRLLTGRVAVESFRNPVLGLNLILAILFLLVYDGTVGDLSLFVGFANGNYYNFILPAAILAAGVGGGAAGLLLVADIQSGYLLRQLTMPIRRSALIASLVIVAAVQVVLQAGVVIGAALLFGAEPETGLLGILGVLGLAFVWGAGFGGYSVAVALISEDTQITSAANLIFIPLIFFSPLLVPYEHLKPWMQLVADVNPTRYLMEGMRSLMISGWNERKLVEALLAGLAFGSAMGALALAAVRVRLLGGRR
jgi:ABC-2 type transport system permease protein